MYSIENINVKAHREKQVRYMFNENIGLKRKTYRYFLDFVCLKATPVLAQGLVLTLCSGFTSDKVWATILLLGIEPVYSTCKASK